MLVVLLFALGFLVGGLLDVLVGLLAAPESSPRSANVAEESVTGAQLSRSPLSMLAGESPARKLALALTLGALFAIAAWRYQDISHLALISVYAAVLVSCAATDLVSFRVPNAITYPAILLAFLVAAFLPDADLLAALSGGAMAGGLMLLALVLSRGAMGLGDVKLATFVGLALGWPFIGPALMLMALAGGAVALVLLLSGLRGRKDPIPYAPFVSGGALTVILWQGTAFATL